MLLVVYIVLYVVIAVVICASLAEWSDNAATALLCVLAVLAFPFSFSVGASLEREGEWQSDRQTVLALNDGRVSSAEAESAFFVSSYRQGEDFKYTFYAEDSKGRIKLYDDKTKYWSIFEDVQPGQQPYIKINFICVRDSSFWTLTACEGTAFDMNELHVPPNTIRQDFLLDAK